MRTKGEQSSCLNGRLRYATSMCGRYARWSPLEFLVEEFDDIRLPAIPWEPSYNVAPQSIQPVVRTGRMEFPK